jgi:hypothetical protein
VKEAERATDRDAIDRLDVAEHPRPQAVAILRRSGLGIGRFEGTTIDDVDDAPGPSVGLGGADEQRAAVQRAARSQFDRLHA